MKESNVKNAFIFHGSYGHPEENWIPWLKSELENQGYQVTVPKFPTPEGQNYDDWMKVIEPHLREFNHETVLIGHSIGPAFALGILEKLNTKIAKAIFVSGFLGLLGNEDFDSINHTISDREFNWEKIKTNCSEFHVLHGENDPYVPLEKASELSSLLDVEPTIIPSGGHLNVNSGFTEFPQLVDLLN